MQRSYGDLCFPLEMMLISFFSYAALHFKLLILCTRPHPRWKSQYSIKSRAQRLHISGTGRLTGYWDLLLSLWALVGGRPVWTSLPVYVSLYHNWTCNNSSESTHFNMLLERSLTYDGVAVWRRVMIFAKFLAWDASSVSISASLYNEILLWFGI